MDTTTFLAITASAGCISAAGSAFLEAWATKSPYHDGTAAHTLSSDNTSRRTVASGVVGCIIGLSFGIVVMVARKWH